MIIGLTGHAGSGKDTVAGMLALMLPNPSHCCSLAFADPMKKFCAEVFDFSEEQLYGKLKETPDKRYPRLNIEPGTGSAYRTYLTPRFALQTLGTEWGRNCYPNIWVEYSIRRAKQFLAEGARVVTITDVRFENEAEAIRAEWGVIWRVVRPGKTGSVGVMGHASETEMDRIQADVTIRNAGTLDDLRSCTLDAWKSLNKGSARRSR